jgi:hypothetical protein
VYPAAFRADYGVQRAQVFRESCREDYRARGGVGVLCLWPLALADRATSALGEPIAERIADGRHMAHVAKEASMTRAVFVRWRGIAAMSGAGLWFIGFNSGFRAPYDSLMPVCLA